MTVETKRQGPLGPMLAWLWPEPREARERRPSWLWLSTFSAWVWPSALQNEGFAPRAGMAWLMHGLWPASFDRWLAKWWGMSWLWSWIWPGKLMGPDGEISALAPWHPATRAACDVVPWQHRIGRKGGMAAMMFAATAIAAPTFMEGNGPQDGGRLNLFRGGGGPGDQGGDQGGGGGGGATDPTGGPSTGGTGGGFNPSNFTGGDTPPSNNPSNFTDPPAGGNPTDGGSPDTGTPDSGPTPGGGDGLTFLDSNPSGGGGAGGSGAGGGGFFGGGGAGGGSGGGGGGGDGGTTPPTGTDPTNPTGPTNPTNPTDPTTGGSNPVGPPAPPTDKPTGPTIDFPIAPGGTEPFVPPTGDGSPKTELPIPGGNQGAAPEGAIPEPATWAMMIVGFGAVGYAVRRRRIMASLSKAA